MASALTSTCNRHDPTGPALHQEQWALATSGVTGMDRIDNLAVMAGRRTLMYAQLDMRVFTTMMSIFGSRDQKRKTALGLHGSHQAVDGRRADGRPCLHGRRAQRHPVAGQVALGGSPLRLDVHRRAAVLRNVGQTCTTGTASVRRMEVWIIKSVSDVIQAADQTLAASRPSQWLNAQKQA